MSITVNPVNDAPVAAEDAYSVYEDNLLTVAIPGVLGNDSDVEGNSLTSVLVSDVSNGDLALNINGSFSYTPDLNFNGTDTFTYTANDGEATSNSATVTITVNAVNDAPVANAQSVETDEDTPVAIILTGSDPENDPLTYSVGAGPSHGTLTGTAPDLTYTPNPDYNGADSFTYQANDGTDDSNVATVTITVNPVNDPPSAVDDGYSVDEDNTLNVAAPGILGNDSDPDGDDLTAVLVNDVSNGTLTLDADGSFTYMPNANFHGTDSFTYQANDGELNSNEATVTITVNPVNDPPVVSDIPDQMIDEGGSFATISLDEYVEDVDNTDEEITWTFGGNVELVVTITDRVATIEPPNGDWNGKETITFTATDPGGLSDGDAATFTVNPVNDAPVAQDDVYSVDEDNSLSVPAPGVIDNDSDVEDDALSAALASDVSNGVLALNADGSFTYTPDADFNGTDSFTYQASDGTDDSNVATVTITINPVNDAPVANFQSVTTAEDTPVAIILTGSDPDRDPLTYSVVTPPSDGSLSGTAPDLTYTPNPDFNGVDSFTYKANDGTDDSNVATVTITVNPVNDAPVAADGAYSVEEDATLTVATPGVLVNDTDVEGDALTAVLVTGPSNGTVTLSIDGSFTYTPDANFNGTDSFTYQANDGTDDSNVATVTITVNPVNDPPSAVDDGYSVDEDNTLNVAAPGVLGNDSDPDGDDLTAVLVNDVSNGTLTLDADGSFAYMPNANFHGTDSFTYKANDDTYDSDVATVTITVNSVNDAPVLAVVDTVADEGEDLHFTVRATDVDGDNLTFSASNLPEGASFDPTTQLFSWTPDFTQAGTYPDMHFEVADGNTTDSADITIIVNNVTPTQLTEQLIVYVKSLDLPKGIERSLTSKLDNVIKSLEKGNDQAAINKLGAFINEVEAQRGKKLAEADADALIAAAQQIIEVIDVEAEEAIKLAMTSPDHFRLLQNHPNPFNPITTIAYNISEASKVTLAVYNITGQRVATLVSGYQEVGHYKVIWDGGRFAAGIYICQMKAGRFAETKCMLLLK